MIAGEVRKPGSFSLRTLRFLSEFSQEDAVNFEIVCQSNFGVLCPKKLLIASDKEDIGYLISLEAAGLIQGASGFLNYTLTFNEHGETFIKEGDVMIVFRGKPNSAADPVEAVLLTPLGRELVGLIPNRDKISIARKVANSIRSEKLHAAYVYMPEPKSTSDRPIDVLWRNENVVTPQ